MYVVEQNDGTNDETVLFGASQQNSWQSFCAVTLRCVPTHFLRQKGEGNGKEKERRFTSYVSNASSIHQNSIVLVQDITYRYTSYLNNAHFNNYQ
jgi:hypothetical protein